MKQTNNAIKFLMAQYRAIFKNAYFKGLATAALVTAGLAVCAAQAATVTLPQPGEGANSITSSNKLDNVIIDGTAYFSGGTTADGAAAATNVTITNGSTLSNYPDTNAALVVSGTLTVDGGTLDLSNSWFQGQAEFDKDDSDGFTGHLIAKNNGEINIENSVFLTATASLGDGVTVNIGGHLQNAAENSKDWNTASSVLGVKASGSTTTSSMLINGATINIEDDGLLTVNANEAATSKSTFTMNSGVINLMGSELARRAKDDTGKTNYDITKDETGAAIVSTNSAIANFNGGQIIVGEGEVGQIHGTNMNFKGTTFDNAGTMQIGGRLTVNKDNTFVGAISMTAGAINNSGVLLLGSAMSYDGKTLVADRSTITAKGGTITNSSDGEVHVYSTLKMTGADLDNEGNLIVEEYAIFELNEVKDNKTVDGVLTVGGNVQVDGRINVVNGTLDLSSASSITSQGSATTLTNPQNTISVGDLVNKKDTGATLKMTEQQVHDFLNTQGFVSAEQRDTAGTIVLGNYGTLDFGDSVTLSNFNFLINNFDHHLGGDLVVYGEDYSSGKNQGANFKATTMTLEDALLRDDTTSAVENLPSTNLIADNLNLHYDGVEAVKDFDGNFSFSKAVVGKNLDVTYEGSDSQLKIANEIELQAYTPATTVNNQTVHAVAQDGTITGNDFVLVNDGTHSGSISVKNGHWTATQNITLTSGTSINVGLDLDGENVTANTTDSSLALNGGLTFDLANGDSTVTVSGLTSFNPLLDTRETNDYSAQLDLTGGLDVINGSSSYSGSITAQSGGVVTLNASDVNKILSNDTGTNDNLNQLGLAATKRGAIQAVNGNVSANFNDFASGASAAKGQVNLSAGGAFITDNLTLAGKSEATAGSNTTLDIGSGSIYADTLTLTDQKNDTGSSYEGNTQVNLAAGNVYVGNSLSTNAADLTVGAGANVYLGDENLVEGTLVANKLTINGTTNFEHGSWNAASVDFNVAGAGAALTVGNTNHENGATLQGNKLALSGTDAELKINSNGTVTVNGLTMSNGAVNVLGQMTVNGIEPETGVTDPDHGVAITGGSITVTGRNAQLTFGDEAVKNISVSSDEVTVENFANNITVNGYATLRLEFADGTSFTEAALKDLRQSLLANAADGLSLDDGYIHLGNGTIDGLNVSGGTIDWDVLEGFKDIKDIRTNGLDSATLTNVDETDIITANVGNIQANGNTQNVQLSDTTLNSAKDLGNGTSAFITNANGEVISATVQGGAIVGFNGGGAIKDLVINSSSIAGNDTVVNITATGEAVTSFESIRGGADTILNVDGVTNVAKNLSIDTLNLNHALTVGGDVTIGNGLYSDSENAIPASLTTSKLTVTGNTYFDGNITASQRASFDSSSETDQVTYLAGNNTFNGGVEFLGGDDTFVELSTGTTTTTEMALTNGVDLLISNNANVVADNVTVKGTAGSGEGTIISVGEVAGQDGTEQWPDSTGYLTTTNLDLNGATLIVDPDYGMATSIAVTDTLGNLTASNDYNEYASGTLNGNLVAARNGIIAVGFNCYDDVTAIEEVQETFATLMDSNGSLQKDNVGAIVYLGHNIEVQNGSKIVVDSTKNRDQYLRDVSVASTTYATNVGNNDVYIAKNSALAVNKNALSQVYNGVTKAAIHFDKDAASLYNDGGKIILTGDDFRTSDTIMLFTDKGGAGHEGIMINGQNLEVTTLNGLLHFYLEAGVETTGKTLELNHDQVDHVFNDASAPVKDTLISYAAKYNDWDSVNPDDQLHGAVVSSVQTTDGKNYTNKADDTPVNDSSNLMSILNADGSTYTVYEKPNNYFLEEVVRGFSGADAETVARLGIFGGAAQSAIAAGSSTYDAVSGRMGVGANGANITVADNTQGAALWLAPIYKSSDSDGFDAEGVDYGVDMDLYGVALGADYTLSNGIRFGAMFNVGSGDIDGQGAGSAVSNDFDYYGFAVYGGYSMGALSVVADVSYTVADNDLEGNTSIDKVGASLDSTNLSVGVTGQYQLDFNGTTVTPHAGLRFSRIDLDDYTVDGEDIIADYDADSMNIFSIPVGVTFAKEFTGDAWTVKPSLDLTLTGNFGDDETDGTVHWAGVDNLSTNVSSEVIDNFTYGATLGVAAKTGNFSLGLGVNYTASSNVDEFGINANARFVF